MLKNGLEKIKQEGRDLRNEFRERTLSYVLAGFGLVAGLAWNEAIKTGIEYLFPMKANKYSGQIDLRDFDHRVIGHNFHLSFPTA